MMMRMKNMTETKNDDYKRGYREGFLDGFHAARDNDSLMSPNIPIPDKVKNISNKLSTSISESNNKVLTMDSFKWY